MFKSSYILLLVLFTGISSAQDEDQPAAGKLCNEDISKKAVTLWEKGTDKKKYKKPERLEFLMKALELEPDFAEANLAMGEELAARCILENKPFKPTVPFFYKAIASCPQIHSHPYYYIGFSYYEELKNDSAIKYLQKF